MVERARAMWGADTLNMDPFLLAVLDQLIANIGDMRLITILLNLTKAHLAAMDSQAGLQKSIFTIAAQLAALTERITTMSDNLESEISVLQGKVAEMTTAEQGAETLLAGLSDQLKAALVHAQNAGATPEQLKALSGLATAIGDNTTALAHAVTANTPQAVVVPQVPPAGATGTPVVPPATEPAPAPVAPANPGVA